MLISKIAKRYAQGLLDFTQEAGQTNHVFSEMKDVVKVMSESRELNKFFQTPFIDVKRKEAAAREIFKNFSSVSQNLINLTIKHGRETHLQNIAQEFINKVEDLRGVQRVSLTSATALSPQNIQEIIRASNLVKPDTQFDLKTVINPEILGGYILRVGDQQVDASVRSKLGNIRKNFELN